MLSAPLPALMTLRENINLTHSAGTSTGVVYNSDTAGLSVILSFTQKLALHFFCLTLNGVDVVFFLTESAPFT